MRKSIISLAVAALATTSVFAESTNVNDAFKNGTFSGDISTHFEHNQNHDGVDDSGFSNASFGLNYSTDSLNGFTLNAGFRANGEIAEEDNSWDNDTPSSILHTANITYANDDVTAILGRQEIALEWITDYHEAIVGVLTAVPNLTVVAGYTDRIAIADFDDMLSDFDDIGDKGAYVVDATYNIGEVGAVQLYYMDAPDIFSAVGGSATVTLEPITLLGKYTQTNEDVDGTEDGDIYQLEVSGDFDVVSASIGYISTDSDGGIGSLDTLGDNINPFEDGNYVYGTDADTVYGMISANIGPVETFVLYGETDYNDGDESELNIGASMEIVSGLSAEALFVTVNADDNNGDADYNKYVANLIYSF